MRVTKKSTSCEIFFCGTSCKPVTHIYRKEKITRRDDFFVTRIYREKKNYTTYRKKKIRHVTIFFPHLPQKKKLRDLPQKKITRCDDFFLRAFTTKAKKLQDLTTEKELPILLKMHACRQCAHLWATSDSAPCSEAVGTAQAAGVM